MMWIDELAAAVSLTLFCGMLLVLAALMSGA